MRQTGECKVVKDEKCETQYLLKYETHCEAGPEVCQTVEEADCSPVCETEYETVQERVCTPVTDEICTTSYEEKCHQEPGHDCGEEGGEVCSTVYDIVSNIQCSEIQEKQCRTFYVPECETIQGLSPPLSPSCFNKIFQIKSVKRIPTYPLFPTTMLLCRILPWEK